RPDPHPRRRPRRRDAGAPAVGGVRAGCLHRQLRGGDGRVLGGAGLLRAVGRRQVDRRGAVRDAGGQRPAVPPGLGGAGLQRRRGAAEPDQPVLDAAAAGVLGLRARDIVGFTFLQLLVHIPLVLGLLWLLGLTLAYVPPVMPG